MKKPLSVTRRARRFTSGKKQEGAVLILVAVSLIVIAGFAAISIDSGRAYGAKARLAAATDAAAIAGVRNLAVGATDAARIANAQAGAQQFFNLNFPQNTGGASVTAPITNVVKQANGQWRVTVNAQATLPTTFARVLGFNQTPIVTMSQTIRRDLDLMMVFDSSGSMDTSIAALKVAAKQNFLSKFIPGPGGDRVGFVSYASGSQVDEPIDRTVTRGFVKSRVESAIDNMVAGGSTASSEGLRRGLEELRAIPAANQSSLRVMLLFSDGAPNTFGLNLDLGGSPTDVNLFSNSQMFDPDSIFQQLSFGSADLPPTMPTVSRGGWPVSGRRPVGSNFSYCDINRASRNLMETVAEEARKDGIVVYSVGLGYNLQGLEASCAYNLAEDKGENLLKRVANTADVDTFDNTQPEGLYCFAADQTQIDDCFEQISRSIIRLTL